MSRLIGEGVRGDEVAASDLCGVHPEEVRTVEGLADDGAPHPLQEAFSAERGLQRGFCTPGFLMLAAGALEKEPGLVDDPDRLRELLTSNLCRCTGYEGIRRAVTRTAEAMRNGQDHT